MLKSFPLRPDLAGFEDRRPLFALDSGMELRRLSELRNESQAYFEFLRTGNFSAGVYRLPVNAIDSQKPHAQDEIYYVVSGAASFQSGQTDITVAPGDILFVPANEPHRFYDIRRDLDVLVFFSPPESHDSHDAP